MRRIKGKINNYFKITKRESNFKTEIYAGITTFISMAYILVVNPNNILQLGTSDPRFTSVFIATALGSFIGTLFMALFAKMPLAQAPGMGLNAMVGAIIGGAFGYSFSYGNAMALIFLSAVLFLILSFVPCQIDKKKHKYISLREKIFDGIPKAIINSITIGVGLFIAFIGLQNAHIITNNDYTLVELVNFNNPANWVPGGEACMAMVALVGLITIGVLSHYKVRGSIVWGIIISTIVAIPLGVADLNILAGKATGISWNVGKSFIDYFNISNENSVFASVMRGGFIFPKESIMTALMLVVSFFLIDMFDTMGTLIGCCKNAGLTDEEGKPINYGEMMYADSASAVVGSVLGTSTVSTYVESSTGISAGGKTGLTALVTAILFFLSIFLLPLFAFIPSPAAASALIYVGVIMMSNVKNVDFKNVKNAIPSFITIVIMLLSYSITDGIGIGIIIYVFIDLIIYLIDYIRYKTHKSRKKPKTDVTLVTIIIVIMFLIYFLMPTI
ncbi:MAG: NCS2 family permease [Bacilli bacterium]|nr:NCS2 family permease [Bacilli bacterium]